MQDFGPVSNHQIVLSFLRAEIDSASRGSRYMDAIRAFGLNRKSLVDNADLTDNHAHHGRALVLGAVRGYGRNDAIFSGFPGDVTWRRVLLEPSEFGVLKYANCDPWLRISKGTRSVLDGAQNIRSCVDQGIAQAVADIVDKIKRAVPLEDLLLIDDLKGSLIILEGNTRATAFVSSMTNAAFALVGRSQTIKTWQFI
jgi:hypothetical protein